MQEILSGRVEFSVEQLDEILGIQIRIGRAGEMERLCWWNADATDIEGGGDFFMRLAGPLSGFCASEAAMEAALEREKYTLAGAGIKAEVVTLFQPPYELRMQLKDRWKTVKRNPYNVPDRLSEFLDHSRRFSVDELTAELQSYPRPVYEKSAFGRRIRSRMPSDPLHLMRQLAALLLPLQKNHYPLPYYPEQ